MQDVQRLQNGRDLAADEFLRLPALPREPGAQVAMLGVLHDEAIAGAGGFDLDEAVEHAQRAGLFGQQLGEVRLAQPACEAVADLDANAGRDSRAGWRGEVDLAESAFADELIETIGPPRLIAVKRWQDGTGLRGRGWLARSGERARGRSGRHDKKVTRAD